MKEKWFFKGRKKKETFQPDREFLEKAIKEYFALGGLITKVVICPEDYQRFMQLQSDFDLGDF